MNRPLLFPLLLAAQLGLATCALADWPNNPGTNVPVQVGPGDAGHPVVVPDGQGGALVLWADDRAGDYDIYAQRLSAAGAPMWAANGVPVGGGSGHQTNVVGAPFGDGGVIFAYTDDSYGWSEDVHVMAIDRDGSVVVFPTGAYVLPGSQIPLEMVRLSGGNYCLSISNRIPGNYDMYASIVTSFGSVGSPYAMCTAPGDQYGGKVVPDAGGGAYVVWSDSRPDASGNNIFAQHIGASGYPNWGTNGLQVSDTGNGNNGFTAVSDGEGGLIAIWNDVEAGRRAIRGVKLDVGGSFLTPPFPLAQNSNENFVTDVMPDGEGGFFMTWSEYEPVTYNYSLVRIGRFTSSGSSYWGAQSLSPTPFAEWSRLAEDGDGGVFVSWRDYVNSSAGYDAVVAQVNAAGAVLGTWPPASFSNASNTQDTPVMIPDGRGGALAVWHDARQYNLGNAWDLYAGRVAPFGRLGNPEPRIVSVTDVMNDQGGRVSVRWNKSYLDKPSNQQIVAYWLWRELPAPIAQEALAAGALSFEEPAAAAAPGRAGDVAGAADGAPGAAGARRVPATGERLIRHAAAGAWAGYWEYVGQQSAQGFASYSMTVATSGDSVPGSNPATRFMVEASGYYGHWESEPANGYSVDNLAPAQPAPFAAVFGGASTALHWAANGEADLAGYRLYRGTSPSFVPDGSTFVADVADTHYVDAISVPRWYKLLAVDSHGNVSPAATAAASGLLDAGVVEARFALARPSPNPARGPVTLRFTLPVAGSARLMVLDAQGRVVRTLAEGERPAGEHAIAWNRRDEGGARVAPGLYFVRLQSGGRNLVERLVALD